MGWCGAVDGMTTSVEEVGTPPHQLELVFQSVLVIPIQVPVSFTVIASVLPEVAAVIQPLSVRLLIVRLVVPTEVSDGVLKVPLLPLLTVIATSVAPWALSPVRV